jgi:tetratricopeptide (TPR) repeat protein
MKSFWVSLAAGLIAGIAIASAATSPPRSGQTAAVAVMAPKSAARPSIAPAPRALPACSALPAAPVVVAEPAAKPITPAKWNPELDRRFLLERARSRQRDYRLTEAERLYRQVLTRAPRDSEALAGLGEVDVLRGTTGAADEHFQAALRANADYIPALIAVADLKWESGRFKEAQQGYQSIVESYAADLYPPYVAQRSSALLPAQCGEQ